MSFKRYLVPALAAGAVVLGMEPAMAITTTIATGAMPSEVVTEVNKIGFTGLSAWAIGVIGLVMAISAGFAVARVGKRGASHI